MLLVTSVRSAGSSGSQACRVASCLMSLVDEEVKGNGQEGCHYPSGSYSGTIFVFLIPKKSGGMWPVINLKNLNRFFESAHFKMEHLLAILPLVSPNCLMTSLFFKGHETSVFPASKESGAVFILLI